MAARLSSELDTDDPVTSMWLRWCAGQTSVRDDIARHYAVWVRSVARSVFMRVRGRGDDWPDYVQNATLGMLEAMKGFDVTRGLPFEAYARARVRGAVFNGLRALKLVSVTTQSAGSSNDAIDSLFEEDDVDPVDRLIAVVTGLALGHGLSIHADWTAAAAVPGPYEAAVRSQLGERLSKHLRRLAERERQVLEWHYLQHLPFVQIADVMGVSKGRISQLHRQALQRLRERMMHDRWRQSL